jgi:hypothetical protein
LTVEPLPHFTDRGKLDLKDALCFFQEIH